MSKPLTPLKCVFKHWKNFDPYVLRKNSLVFFYSHAWLAYTLEPKWNAEGNTDYGAVSQLQLCCQKEEKWSELPNLQTNFLLRNNLCVQNVNETTENQTSLVLNASTIIESGTIFSCPFDLKNMISKETLIKASFIVNEPQDEFSKATLIKASSFITESEGSPTCILSLQVRFLSQA